MKKQVKIAMQMMLTITLSVFICASSYANTLTIDLIEVEETELTEDFYLELCFENTESKNKNVNKTKYLDTPSLQNEVFYYDFRTIQSIRLNHIPLIKKEALPSFKRYLLYCSITVYN